MHQFLTKGPAPRQRLVPARAHAASSVASPVAGLGGRHALMLMSALILWFAAAGNQVNSFGIARGAAGEIMPAGHGQSPSNQSASNQSSDRAIQLNVPGVTYGFLDEQPADFEGVTWPRKARLKTGDLVMLQPITRNAGEIHPLIAPGPLMTYCQVVGTTRGELKGAVCLIC